MRRVALHAAAVGAIMLSAAFTPQAQSGETAQKSIRARFVCAGGRSIDATFVNGAMSHVQLTLSDGRRLTVPQAASASGARYANADETFVFWNKGTTAFVEEAGKTTYDGCTTKR